MADENLIPKIDRLRGRFRMLEFYASEKCEKEKALSYRTLLDKSQVLMLRGRFQTALRLLESYKDEQDPTVSPQAPIKRKVSFRKNRGRTDGTNQTTKKE